MDRPRALLPRRGRRALGLERFHLVVHDIGRPGAWVDLLRRGDDGAAFLRIMCGFESTPAKRALYVSAVHDVPYPVQIVWGERDPALKIGAHGEQARRAAGLTTIHRVPAKHLLQEDQPAAVAGHVAALAAMSPGH